MLSPSAYRNGNGSSIEHVTPQFGLGPNALQDASTVTHRDKGSALPSKEDSSEKLKIEDGPEQKKEDDGYDRLDEVNIEDEEIIEEE
ncbi:unnamed protein product [Caenorhabditis nigoni]